MFASVDFTNPANIFTKGPNGEKVFTRFVFNDNYKMLLTDPLNNGPTGEPPCYNQYGNPPYLDNAYSFLAQPIVELLSVGALPVAGNQPIIMNIYLGPGEHFFFACTLSGR